MTVHLGRGIAAVGECMIEISDAQGDRWRMGFAGDTLNTLWYMRALLPKRTVDFISAFGDDSFSEQQRTFLNDARIGIDHSPTIAGSRPGLYAITLDGAERSFTYWRSDSAARSLADDKEALHRSLAGRDLIYLTGITLAILSDDARECLFDVLAMARKGGARIAFDPNHRPRLWANPDLARTSYERTMALSDIVLPTFDDEATLYGDKTPQESIRRIADFGVGEIVVKCGAMPAHVWHANTTIIVPAQTTTAVDTTGAGDSFCGGYLAARLTGVNPASAASVAHQIAARVVARHGALIPIDTIADLQIPDPHMEAQ